MIGKGLPESVQYILTCLSNHPPPNASKAEEGMGCSSIDYSIFGPHAERKPQGCELGECKHQGKYSQNCIYTLGTLMGQSRQIYWSYSYSTNGSPAELFESVRTSLILLLPDYKYHKTKGLPMPYSSACSEMTMSLQLCSEAILTNCKSMLFVHWLRRKKHTAYLLRHSDFPLQIKKRKSYSMS